MERREFTKFHLIMVIAALVGLGTIIWAVISIHGIKNKEAEEVVKVVETVENIVETEETETLPEDVEGPDFTLNEFELEKTKVRLNNKGRYNIDELNSIINENISFVDEAGNNIEIKLSTDNSLEDALITSDMYKSCLSVWAPGNSCIILIFEMGNKNPGELTTNIREYFEFMQRSTSGMSTADIYKYYETFSYNGYAVYVAHENAIDLTGAIQDYMQNADEQAVKDFESLYKVNEYGAYLIETDENTEEVEAGTDGIVEGNVGGSAEGPLADITSENSSSTVESETNENIWETNEIETDTVEVEVN